MKINLKATIDTTKSAEASLSDLLVKQDLHMAEDTASFNTWKSFGAEDLLLWCLQTDL